MRLLLIDDHPLFRQGFSAMLAEARPDWVVVCASCAAEGEAAAGDPELDLILVDLALPDADGFDTIERIGAIAPSTPRVVISARTDEGAQRLAIKAGASGFISKGDDARAVLSCLERVVEGASGFEDGVVADGLILSPRQIEVLALVAEGCPNKEIRHRLGSPSGRSAFTSPTCSRRWACSRAFRRCCGRRRSGCSGDRPGSRGVDPDALCSGAHLRARRRRGHRLHGRDGLAV